MNEDILELSAKLDQTLGQNIPLGQPRTWGKGGTMYPSIYIPSRENELKLPTSGKAVVNYKVVSRSYHERDGKKRHTADIEVQSIQPYVTPARATLNGEKAIHLSDRTRDQGGRYTQGGSLASPKDFRDAVKSQKRKKLGRIAAGAALVAGGGIIGGTSTGRAGLVRATGRLLGN